MRPIRQTVAALNCLAPAVLGVFLAVLEAQQAPDAAVEKPLSFEVATFKPAATDAVGSMFWFNPDGVKIRNLPLMTIVREAFGLEPDRIFSESGVAKVSSNFDIEAKVAPEDAQKFKVLSIEKRNQMVVSLLEERCGLKYHHETRELPEYELVVATGGVKMTASKPDKANGEGRGQHLWRMRRGQVESTGTGMSDLARILSGQLGRTVVDKTGLTGNYDYKLAWTPDDVPPAMTKPGSSDASEGGAAAPDTSAPSLFTALQVQLGLKLEATKGPVDVVVIDRLQQPSAN